MKTARLLPLAALTLLQACGEGGSDIRDKVLAAPEKGICALDSVNGKEFVGDSVDVAANEAVTFVGWAGDSDRKTPSAVTVVLQNGRSGIGIEGALGAPRPDVAQAHGSPDLGKSGFTASGKASVGAGTYSVVLLMKGSRRDERCDTHRILNVK